MLYSSYWETKSPNRSHKVKKKKKVIQITSVKHKKKKKKKKKEGKAHNNHQKPSNSSNNHLTSTNSNPSRLKNLCRAGPWGVHRAQPNRASQCDEPWEKNYCSISPPPLKKEKLTCFIFQFLSKNSCSMFLFLSLKTRI